MVSEITIDQVPRLVTEAFEGIFENLKQFGTDAGLVRLLNSGNLFLKNACNGKYGHTFEKGSFQYQTNTQFF